MTAWSTISTSSDQRWPQRQHRLAENIGRVLDRQMIDVTSPDSPHPGHGPWDSVVGIRTPLARLAMTPSWPKVLPLQAEIIASPCRVSPDAAPAQGRRSICRYEECRGFRRHSAPACRAAMELARGSIRLGPGPTLAIYPHGQAGVSNMGCVG